MQASRGRRRLDLDDFNTIAKKLTTGSGSSKVYGFGLPNFNFGLTPWLYSNGTTQLNSDWTASNLTDAKVAASVTSTPLTW